MRNGRGDLLDDERAWHQLQREKPSAFAIFEKELAWNTDTERDYCQRPVYFHNWLNNPSRKRARRKGNLRQLVCDLLLHNTYKTAKADILYFFHESQHLRCEPIERHLYVHAGELNRDPAVQRTLESKMHPIIDEVKESLRVQLLRRPISHEPYLLDEYALLKTASILTPRLFRECVPSIVRQIAPFADETSILYSIFLCLETWGCDPNTISDEDLRYRDLYASKESSPAGRSHGEHLHWYDGMYGEADGFRLLNCGRYDAEKIVALHRDVIRANIINRTYAKCLDRSGNAAWVQNGRGNAAWVQADLFKVWLSVQVLDGGWNKLTLDQAEKVLDIVLFTRSAMSAAKCGKLESPRIRWIMSTLERILKDPPYELTRGTLSKEMRPAVEARAKTAA